MSDTRAEAYESIQPFLKKMNLKIWQRVCDAGPHGLTCDEAEFVLAMKHQTVSSAFTRLREGGWIYDTGRRRKTRSGRNAAVYRGKLPTEAPRELP